MIREQMGNLARQPMANLRIREVRKRDGRLAPFDADKIQRAIEKAAMQIGRDDASALSVRITEKVIGVIASNFPQFTTPHVENVQDTVISVLQDAGLKELSEVYLHYREERTRIRSQAMNLTKEIGSIIQEAQRGVEGNANVGDNFSAKLLQIASAASKWYYLNEVIPEEFARAHQSGWIHIHDLDSYGKTLNCMQIPLETLLKEGFSTGYGYIRPPKRIGSAAMLMCIVMQSAQNDMYGGQSIPYMDKALAPYVDPRYDGCEEPETLAAIEKEVYQAMEGVVHNLNTLHSRAGSQVPFSSVNLGCDMTPRGRLVTKMFLQAFNAGLGRGETPIFPNAVFRLKKGVNFNPEDPNYDLYQLALKVAGRRMNPTFSFMDASMNAPFGDLASYMGCRSRLLDNCHGESTPEGRGSIAPVSLNLVRIALEAQTPEEFMAVLDSVVNLAERQLLHRVEILKSLQVRDIPFVMGEGLYLNSKGLNPEDSIWQAMKHGSINLGFIGLAEALKILVGAHHGESPLAQELGLKIVARLREHTDRIGKQYDLNCTCYATPAEGLSGRFVLLDRKKYGLVPGITDKDYYTNSYHIPVDFPISIFEKIRLEGPYHRYCNAGHISYIEVEAPLDHNPEALEAIHRAMLDADMGYGSVNFPIDECVDCAHHSIFEGDICPNCGSTSINRIRRVTGYLSYLHRFACGKRAEYEDRRGHQE